MMSALTRSLKALHKDEQGANMVEYILLVVAVALPLLAVLVWFWRDISAWANKLYQEARQGQETDPSTLGH